MLQKHFTLLLFAASTLSGIATAQTFLPFNHGGYADSVIPTVETFMMSKYGSVSPSLYTGAMSYSIPLYEYKDPDFDLPISIGYHYDGLKVSANSGTVGMGWFLDCGGVITRDVVGIPDERKIESEWSSDIGGMNEVGYFYTLTAPANSFYSDCVESLPWRTYIDLMWSGEELHSDDVPSLLITKSRPTFPSTEKRVVGVVGGAGSFPAKAFDTSSDTYHFNFFGKHGDFILVKGNDTGKVTAKVYNSNMPHSEIDINVDVIERGYDGNYFPLLRFAIKTGDGYKYEFGGALSNTEYAYNNTLMPDPRLVVPSAFKLYRVTAPNERTMELSYSEGQNCYGQHYLSYCDNKPNLYGQANVHYNGTEDKATKTVTIWSYPVRHISVDGCRIIDFSYSERGNSNDEFNGSYHNDPEAVRRAIAIVGHENPKRLSSICIYGKDGVQYDSITFIHSYTKASSGTYKAPPKMFLRSVTCREGTTSFEYENAGPDSEYPPLDSEHIDHWGYYNINGRFPVTSWNEQDKSLYDINRDWRAPDYYKAVYGALKRIEYPTGGYSTIEYEPNDAGKLIDRVGSCVTLRDNNMCFKIGGIRVKKISHHSGNIGGVDDSVEYRYVDRASGKSSGILLNMPRYAILLEYSLSGQINRPENYPGSVAIEGNDAKLAFMREGHIGYSYVQAYHADGSFEEYKFSDYKSYQDLYDYDDILGKGQHSISIFDSGMFRSETLTYVSISPKGGQEQFLYPKNIDNSCMRGKEEYRRIYDSNGRLVLETINSYGQEELGWQTRYADIITCTMKYSFSLLWPYLFQTETTQYYYDNAGNLTGSMKQTVHHEYNGCGQKSSETHIAGTNTTKIIYKYINETNESNPSGHKYLISDAYKTVEVDGAEKVVAAEHYVYGQQGNPHPTSVQYYVIDTPKDMSSLPSCSYKTVSFTYDNHHRITRADYPGGAYTVFTWSTDGRHVTSRCVNATDNLFSYEWKDLVGLSKAENPTGQSETYLYDNKNRLMQRRDTKGNPTKEYRYKITNE